MSLDSRLLSPSRSNSSSASSALVSVGVSSDGSSTRGLSLQFHASRSFAHPQPRSRAPRRTAQCIDDADGTAASMRSSVNVPRRRAARCAPPCCARRADVAARLLRPVDVEQPRRPHQFRRGRMHERRSAASCADLVGDDDRDVAPHRLLARHRHDTTGMSRTSSASASSSNSTGERGSSYAWRQRGCSSPIMPDVAAIELDARAAARDAAPDARRRRSAPPRGANSASTSPLMSKKSTGAFGLRPTAAASALP